MCSGSGYPDRLEAKDARQVENTNNGIEEMIKELMENHTIG
jgi:hypothetical protein